MDTKSEVKLKIEIVNKSEKMQLKSDRDSQRSLPVSPCFCVWINLKLLKGLQALRKIGRSQTPPLGFYGASDELMSSTMFNPFYWKIKPLIFSTIGRSPPFFCWVKTCVFPINLFNKSKPLFPRCCHSALISVS